MAEKFTQKLKVEKKSRFKLDNLLVVIALQKLLCFRTEKLVKAFLTFLDKSVPDLRLLYTANSAF
jgi:hypothetical protein